jgi:TolA-binding protein
MRPSSRISHLALALALLAPACYSQSDGEALRRDLDALKKELAKNAARTEQERVKLQKVMEQATGLLTRNSADLGVQVERMQAKVDRFAGELETRQRKVDDLAQKLAEFQAKVDVKLEGLSAESKRTNNPPTPGDKEELFKQGQQKLLAGDHQEARRLLRHFLERFATDSRIDRVQLMLGDSYYAEQKFAPAIVEYRKIVEQYKQSAVIPDALGKIGMAFYQLKFCRDAEPFFGQLVKKYPKHAQAAQAKKVLALIKRYAKNREVCRP